jgi:hypothetical protein
MPRGRPKATRSAYSGKRSSNSTYCLSTLRFLRICAARVGSLPAVHGSLENSAPQVCVDRLRDLHCGLALDLAGASLVWTWLTTANERVGRGVSNPLLRVRGYIGCSDAGHDDRALAPYKYQTRACVLLLLASLAIARSPPQRRRGPPVRCQGG